MRSRCQHKSAQTAPGAILPLLALLLFLAAPLLPAQSIVYDMDALLESGAVTWAEAVRFVLPAAGVEVANVAEAFALAAALRWLPRNAAPERAVDLAGLSFLLMQAFNLSGGLLYSLFPGPRYAYRELVYRGIVRGPRDRAWKVSGPLLIALIGRTLDSGGTEE
jgi:hypothetical protein